MGFTRFFLRGKEHVENELGFALMAVNLWKFAAGISTTLFENENTKNKTGCDLLSRKITSSFHFIFSSFVSDSFSIDVMLQLEQSISLVKRYNIQLKLKRIYLF
ncbi:hypothetical protein SAMN05421839_1325 [Halolactibacillus halophilus]|uniref:Transposase DDE domain-containing protein n=1 Tax=Halolactibacillus halophilus TaxID=306540 RepID=A0A1I5RM55_9BACI|nr:hypothetical protein HHA03_19560 [Halolactibacillus halophilus]SFP59634.1 hypothetical protein SAMN05421839_1325 [Halolactibacillus halophilus]